jgi:hypothetical protein
MNKSLIARLGGSWSWHLVYGLVSIVMGLIAVAWPSPTLVVLAVVFGAQLIAAGVFRLVGSASLGEGRHSPHPHRNPRRREPAARAYAIRHLLITLLTLGLLLGV